MQCPSCGKAQPMSFKCRSCGAPLVNRPGGVARPTAGPPRPQPQASAAAVALDNPYQAPAVAAPAHIRASYGESALASRVSRLLAQLVDGLMVFVAYLPFILAGGAEAVESSNPPVVAVMVTFLLIIGLVVVQFVYLTRDGQTIGKKAMKIRIVRYDDDGNPGFVKAVLLRAIFNGILGCFPGYALVDILFIFGAEQRCIHDQIAGTKVVEA
jgi:uncharacterized RDD family membrane protein YckC